MGEYGEGVGAFDVVVVSVVIEEDDDSVITVIVVVSVILVVVVDVVSLSEEFDVSFVLFGIVVVVTGGVVEGDKLFGTESAKSIDGQGSVPVNELIADNINQNTNHK